jgi:hypothetical protein
MASITPGVAGDAYIEERPWAFVPLRCALFGDVTFSIALPTEKINNRRVNVTCRNLSMLTRIN